MRWTRDEFIARHFHEFAGYILDGVTTRRAGAPLALWLEEIQDKIRRRLGAAYDDLGGGQAAQAAQVPPLQNGTPQPPRQAPQTANQRPPLQPITGTHPQRVEQKK